MNLSPSPPNCSKESWKLLSLPEIYSSTFNDVRFVEEDWVLYGRKQSRSDGNCGWGSWGERLGVLRTSLSRQVFPLWGHFSPTKCFFPYFFFLFFLKGTLNTEDCPVSVSGRKVQKSFGILMSLRQLNRLQWH